MYNGYFYYCITNIGINILSQSFDENLNLKKLIRAWMFGEIKVKRKIKNKKTPAEI